MATWCTAPAAARMRREAGGSLHAERQLDADTAQEVMRWAACALVAAAEAADRQ